MLTDGGPRLGRNVSFICQLGLSTRTVYAIFV